MANTKPYPWKCGHCLHKAVEPAIEPYETEIEHDGRIYLVSLEELEVHRCRNCNTLMLDDVANRAVSVQFRKVAGLLTPEEIRARRVELELKQKDMARDLGIAEATLSRWETGAQIQQRAMDKLLRLYFEVPEARNFLSCEKRPITCPPSTVQQKDSDTVASH